MDADAIVTQQGIADTQHHAALLGGKETLVNRCCPRRIRRANPQFIVPAPQRVQMAAGVSPGPCISAWCLACGLYMRRSATLRLFIASPLPLLNSCGACCPPWNEYLRTAESGPEQLTSDIDEFR
jgi:hypothetical protein